MSNAVAVGYEVLGYFIDVEDELNAYNVIVVVDEGHERLTCYTPIGGHTEMCRGYFEHECREITKEEYLKVSGHLYTPEDYLQ